MSPRSAEFMAGARDALVAARGALAAGSSRGAASAAYYAMLYAARAALSEEEKNAKTHRGTWDLFHGEFVATDRFDGRLYERARETQRTRELADYDALMVPREDAEEILALAERFVDAIDALFAG
jgi:uncharacterized protein (UPF0332 family)